MAFFEGSSARRRGGASPVSAFVIEAVLLILFLAASLAVVMGMLSLSYRQEAQAALKTRAMSYAMECAERFVIECEDEAASYARSEDGMAIRCTVTSFPTASGVMHYAHIEVYPTEDVPVPVHPLATLSLPAADEQGGEVDEAIAFELDTARYVSKAVG